MWLERLWWGGEQIQRPRFTAMFSVEEVGVYELAAPKAAAKPRKMVSTDLAGSVYRDTGASYRQRPPSKWCLGGLHCNV